MLITLSAHKLYEEHSGGLVSITTCHHIFQIYSGITSGICRVLDGKLLYTEILEVNLFAFAYRLFHEGFSPIYEAIFTQPFSIFIKTNLVGFLVG